jgi:hypothetical protein
MMVAVAVLAAAFAAGKILWYRSSKWHRHLSAEMTWSGSPAEQFYARPGLEEYTANSLLKVSDLGRPGYDGGYDRHRWWLAPVPELRSYGTFHHQFGAGGGGGQHRLTAAEWVQAQQIISKLPPSNSPYLEGDLLLVSFRSNGSWVTRGYDKAALPPAVQDLMKFLRRE